MAKSPKLAVVYRPIAALTPYAGNARTHSDEQVAQIRASIEAFGFTNPILIDETGSILAGHGRVEAAKTIELEKVPTITVPGLTEPQKRAYRLADNKLALNADWDIKTLAHELAELDTGEIDLTLTGFSAEDLEEILTWTPTQPDLFAEQDEIPDPPERPVTVLGDLWELGPHRLLCGDCTSVSAMEQLVGETKVTLCLTDPPYSVDYEKSHVNREDGRRQVSQNVKKVHAGYQEAGKDQAQLLTFLGNLPCGQLVFSYPVDRHFFALGEALKQHGWTVRKELIWLKDTAAFWAGAAYQQRHEPILVCTKGSTAFRRNVDTKQTTILEFPRPKAHDNHPTEKPVELWKRLMANHSDRGEAVVDPFCGSGTTLIAAQITGRVGLGMELAPAYVDVAINRWQRLTGKTAALNGESFPDVAVRRITETPVAAAQA